MITTRKIKYDDYDRGVIELLSQLTLIDKKCISRRDFESFVDSLGVFHQIIVNEYESRIIACATILIETKLIHNLSKVGHIEDVVVDNAFRGKGLGKELIEYLVKLAKDAGCYKVILNCKLENVGFYRKCGFKAKEIEMVTRFD